MNVSLRTLSTNERGGATAPLMALCIAAFIFYLRGGELLLQSALPHHIHMLLVTIVVVITVFTIGLQCTLVITGEQSPRQLRRTLKRQLKELATITSAAQERLKRIEDCVSWQSRLVRPIAYDHASRAQELLFRLINRGRSVEALLGSRSKDKLFEAAALIGSPLAPFDSCVDSLIKARPLPTLEPEQWIPTLEQLLSATEFEVEKAEQRIRRKAA